MSITVKNAKIWWTITFLLSYSILGMILAIPGPTLLDLQCKLRTTPEGIFYIFTSRAGGYVVGSMLGGILHDRNRQEPLIMGALLLSSVGITLAPWCPTVPLLCACLGVVGVLSGSMDPGIHVFLVTMWRDKSAPFIQAIHFAFGIGALVAPLIAEPFLAPTNHNNNKSAENFTDSLCDSYNLASSFGHRQLNIEIAYMIIGCCGACAFVICFSLFLLTRKLVLHFPKTVGSSGQNKTDRSKCLTKMAIIGMAFVLIFNACGFEFLLGQLLATFAVTSKLQMTKSAASYLTSCFWTCYTVGRIPAIVLSSRFSSASIISANVGLPVIGGILLVGWGESYQAALWAGTVITGFGIAPIFGSSLAFLNELFPLTGKISGGFVVSAAIGEMLLPLVVAKYMEVFPALLLYMALGISIFCCVVVLILNLLARLYRRQSLVAADDTGEAGAANRPSSNNLSFDNSSFHLEGHIKL